MPGLQARAQWYDRVEDLLGVHINLIATFVLVLGFVLRLRAASGTFLNPDEALHFGIANQLSLLNAYKASLSTAHPPLLILVIYFWRSLGTSEFVLRLPSVVGGTAFCWVFYKWLASISGRIVGVIGLIFATFLPPLIALSAEVRQYALLLCFLMTSVYFLERAFTEESVAWMLLSSAFLYLAMLTHYSALLCAGAIAGYAVLRMAVRRLPGTLTIAWVVGQAGAIGVFSFLYVTHISKLGGSDPEKQAIHGWLRNSYFQPGRDHLLTFVIARSFGVFQFIFGQLAVGDIAFLLFVAGVVFLLRGKALPGQTSLAARLLGAFLVLPFALNCAASIAGKYPYGGTRHSAYLAIFALAGVSLGVMRLVGPPMGRGVAAAILIVVLSTVFGNPRRPYMLREDQSKTNMTRATDAISRQVSPADLIFADAQTYLFLSHYLCQQRPVVIELLGRDFVKFNCAGRRLVSTRFETTVFTAETFLSRWDEMVRAQGLKPGDTVWVFQAGWDIGLAQELQRKFPEFRDLRAQSFGRNITLFRLTVGQPMPSAVGPRNSFLWCGAGNFSG